MRTLKCPLLRTLVLATCSALPLGAETVFEDGFNGGVKPAWELIRGDAAYVTQNATNLQVRASSGVLTLGANNAKNVFLIDNPVTGDFVITVRIENYAGANVNYDQFDILAYDDDDNHVRCNYVHIAGKRYIEFGKEVAQVWSPATFEHDFSAASFYLRLAKAGNVYTQSYSNDGVAFLPINGTITYGDGTPEKLGFVVSDDPTETSAARIDSFRVTAEAAPATVRIAGAKRVVTRSRIHILRGSSTNAVKVEVKVGASPYRRALGLRSWSHRARLRVGRNEIMARAVNADGIASVPSRLTLVYHP